MAEDTGLDQSVAAGLSTDDIRPNIYEGGFKTWESSLDLASNDVHFLEDLELQRPFAPADLHIIEVCLSPGSSFATHLWI